jgi:hypothetical protein
MIDGDFDEFTLMNTVHPFGIDVKQENKLSVKLTIEPFKDKNTNSKGYVLYLQKNMPFCKDLTGLKPCKFNNTFYGDVFEINKQGLKTKELLLFQILPETKEIIIDVFYGFYPVSNKELFKIIDQHLWHKKTPIARGLKSFKTFKGIKN